ncbi:heterokaryon incompatibility domain-containing protein [Trichoderma sp. SZMC 28013]
MNNRCQLCSGLSIETLIRLAKQEFSGYEFPASAYYQHHNSFHDLEQAANSSCDFCLLIVDCFKGIPWIRGESYEISSYLWEQPEIEIEDSAYNAAKQLALSDVKLSINTDHVYSEDGLDKVRSFTTLLVQIGPTELPEESSDYAFPFLTLSINDPGCFVEIEGIKIGRRKIHPDLGSPHQFQIARRWLQECRTHEACLMNKIPELPTRVVDIGLPDAKSLPRVFVSYGAKADYIALSHCWGGRIESVLTSKTYHDYQQALPISEISANFKDTFRIARELGIQYVWIDSLCIIQDSTEDWEIESSRMGAVYRNATLTVSALVSAKSTVGILKADENRFLGAPKSAKLRIYEDSSKDDEVEVDWKPLEEENLRDLMSKGVLSSRGWTLQEYILSPRNLLYGKRQIYWRCPSMMKSADATPEGFPFPDRNFQKASQVIYSDILAAAPEIESDIKAVLEDYYELAETYSARQLTYGSDKHAAFSGIAQMVHPSIGGQYLAGLWTVDFKHGLLWYAEMASCRHVETHGAPSWSWMVTDARVLFSRIRILESTPFDVKILQYNGIPQDAVKQFGQIESASVVVEGLTMPLIRSKQHVQARDRDDLLFGSVHYDEPLSADDDGDGGVGTWIFITNGPVLGQALISMHVDSGTDDDIDVNSNLILEKNLLVLLVQADEHFDNEMGSSFGEGIILRPVKHGLEDVYERIGYVTFWRPSMDYFREWGSRSLKMI